ncbi:hypothetical protein MRX96_012016 [Rhipicephalus microplus]
MTVVLAGVGLSNAEKKLAHVVQSSGRFKLVFLADIAAEIKPGALAQYSSGQLLGDTYRIAIRYGPFSGKAGDLESRALENDAQATTPIQNRAGGLPRKSSDSIATPDLEILIQ